MRKLSLLGVLGTHREVAELGFKPRICDLNPLPFPQYLGGRKLGAEPLGLYAADYLRQLPFSASICCFVSLISGGLSVHLHHQFIFNE